MPTAPFFLAQGTAELYFLPQMANRHGLIAGATGTGKTVTLRTLAENFSAIGVPVFLADVKGDLGGLAKPGANSPKILERAQQLGLEITPNGFPVTFWDVFGKKGHPVRTTISDMGPLLLSRLLNLNETQEGVLNIVFHIADEQGLLLLDLKDLQAMLQHVAREASEFTTKYGNVTPASIGTIQRALLTLEREGGGVFFGEPALDLADFMRPAEDGRGMINILAADQLMTAPRTYAAFMLWMLSELFERLPEVGDVDKPKLVFFFDEAHLLFADLPAAMQEKVEQVVRLIRSKGVGVYFVSQNPLDIPDRVLGQLGNRVQHALRAFTPRDQKAVRAAAETFRANPKLDVEKVIGELAVGEALVSLLDAKGTPGIVERAFIAPPVSDLSPLAEEERGILIEGSEVFGKYEQTVDRESAYEILEGTAPAPAARPAPAAAAAAPYDAIAAARARSAARQQSAAENAPAATGPFSSPAQGSNPFAGPAPTRGASSTGSDAERIFCDAPADAPPAPRPVPVRSSREEMQAAEADARLAELRARAAEREAKTRAADALAQKRSQQPSLIGKVAESVARGAASQAARSFMRGLLGNLFGGKSR
jgi:DNA helicase HerA-like ATPase